MSSSELSQLKNEIVQRLKNGQKLHNMNKEGYILFYYENGYYHYITVDMKSNETIIKDDEEMIQFLISDPSNVNIYKKEENKPSKRGYKKKLNRRWKIYQEKLITVSCDDTNESSSCDSNSGKSNNESSRSESKYQQSEMLNYDSKVSDNSELVQPVTKEKKRIKKGRH
ncbi:unnamed protein product [Brachionus calyciflorus]|uniref:Uncharacterized protein n=1 Tax=Brachionus calyciflorus TaxID=104777 RepID=A0A814DJ55_9BILA|nr:unnamed protein product [Brachionus calyciflorus]